MGCLKIAPSATAQPNVNEHVTAQIVVPSNRIIEKCCGLGWRNGRNTTGVDDRAETCFLERNRWIRDSVCRLQLIGIKTASADISSSNPNGHADRRSNRNVLSRRDPDTHASGSRVADSGSDAHAKTYSDTNADGYPNANPDSYADSDSSCRRVFSRPRVRHGPP